MEDRPAAAGDVVTRGRALDDLVETMVVGAGAGLLALMIGVVALMVGDRAMMSEVLTRGRARRRGRGQE